MKSFNAIFILFASALSLSAQAGSISKHCFSQAEKFVEAQKPHDYYDANGFEAYNCGLTPNEKAILCEVSGSKGDGDAMDSFVVVMNLSCTKAFRVEQTGEE